METLYQEYLVPTGTLVKPYNWLTFTQDCLKCPYHIKTGEEARIPYMEFYELFGFPYGPTMPLQRHLTFYELRTSHGIVIQKGQASNCTFYSLHPESMLFDVDGYLDSVMYTYEDISYITLYANYTPCNEYSNYCINKMYDFLSSYPNTRLDIYFSQLYHTTEDNPEAVWNCTGLHTLSSLWPRVTINPISGGMWVSLLHRFVNGVSEMTFYNPILPIRAFADKYNAIQIAAITGVNPFFIDTVPQAMHRYPIHRHRATHEYTLKPSAKPSYLMMNKQMSPMVPPPVKYVPFCPFISFPPGLQYPYQFTNMNPKRTVVRHLQPSDEIKNEHSSAKLSHNIRQIEEVTVTEYVVKENADDTKEQKKKRRKTKR
ncbi:putative C-_U-editing enzyme APOBEC-4 [Protopterus annectens]|uniref:APOBEC-4 n=1 Tax=Protopterus annectens TaxID=7888 RepID=A0A0M3WMP9_PROAN|nr:putative C->U-editing enzyme APOBEC-4 [Protopterus annectens]AKL90516.1 APOBEC-4 [Protopterus annectens]